ncbi:hypothetical protein [Rosistilla oblonga]|uniref:Uncharacterized protein n=1 Tax=Rosistilla oblonga TaxID=2527990 RepID=A0A518IU32_9BACT|nr:hypothetical protein [Rosistilla oblonga]QDV56594.1 hypothetical protein Mal33_25860 [Rosistilla oblonga]
MIADITLALADKCIAQRRSNPPQQISHLGVKLRCKYQHEAQASEFSLFSHTGATLSRVEFESLACASCWYALIVVRFGAYAFSETSQAVEHAVGLLDSWHIGVADAVS